MDRSHNPTIDIASKVSGRNRARYSNGCLSLFGLQEDNIKRFPIYLMFISFNLAVSAYAEIIEEKKIFSTCRKAADWVHSGVEVAFATPVVQSRYLNDKQQARPFRFTRSVDVIWVFDDSESSITLRVPAWPNMTGPEVAALRNFRTKMIAHELGHLRTARESLPAGATTITGEGATPNAALAALERKLRAHEKEIHTKVHHENIIYDAKTSHGVNQSAVGGKNIKFTCPRKRGA